MVSKVLPTGDFLGQTNLDSSVVKETQAIASELCRNFYSLGWVSGTGGSIAIKVHEDSVPMSCQLIVMSPSGVQKERMVAEDMHVLSSDGLILSSPPRKHYPHKLPKCTDSAPVFLKAYEMCNAGAVIHSHAVEACLVTMINPCSREFRISHLEMIKGIHGHGYHDELVVPIIENTAHERELVDAFTEAVINYPNTTAILVRNHGVYIWGDSWISAKTQAECYHYLFDAAIKLHQLGMDWSTPSHSSVHEFSRRCERGGEASRVLKPGASRIDRLIEPSNRCILLDMEGTISPISSVTGNSNCIDGYLVKHFTALHDSIENQHDITLPCSQSHARTTEFKGNELAGVIYDDIPEALERWHASGIKVYLFSSTSREADQFVLSNSNYGNLRMHFCGFFGTSMGSKKESRSYTEIARTVGVDKPRDMLFVTSILQDAEAAKAAGLEVMISVRPGNGPLLENHEFRMIKSLLEI